MAWWRQAITWANNQAITWANIDPDLSPHIASLHLNELNPLHAKSFGWQINAWINNCLKLGK